MTAKEIGTTDLHRRAYEIAWREFSALCNLMTPTKSEAGLGGSVGISRS